MFKPVKILSLLLLLFLFITGTAQASKLDEILESGKIRVGVSLFTPWAMKTTNDGLMGFEIDVANKLAEEMGVKPEFKVVVWENIIPALENDEIDVIISGMSITPSRALRINFSNPYAESGTSLATNISKTKDIKTMKELNQPETSIAVVSQTLGAELAGLLFDKATIKPFSDSAEAEKSVLNGDSHGYVASMIETNFLMLKNPKVIDLPLGKPLMISKAGIAVKRGNQELLNYLNAWITAHTADRWLPTRHKYWFKTLKWEKELAE